MDPKRLVIGTLAGGVTLFIVGYLIFDVLTPGFYFSNLIADTSAYRNPNLKWAIALGDLASGALVTLCIVSRVGTPTIGTGFITGAIIGFLLWLHADFTVYGLTNVWNVTLPLVDPLLEAIHHGSAGAAIAAVLARMPKAAGVQQAH